MFGIFRKREKAEELESEVQEIHSSRYTYVDSEHNQGILIGKHLGEYSGQEVRLDPFNPSTTSPHIGVTGSSGGGKTSLIKTMLKNEERDMKRFVISTRGYEFENMENTSVVKDMVVNPFYIKEGIMDRSRYIVEFFRRFGELKHTPVASLEPYDEYHLIEFIEQFLEKYAYEDTYSFSSLQNELTAACQLLEDKIDHNMKLFSHSYQSSKEKPYDFFMKHQDHFKFIEEFKTIQIYKKLQDYIDCMKNEGLLKYFEGRSNIYPLHYGITVINLMELELEVYRYSKNTTFVLSVLLDYVHQIGMDQKGKTAIYIDPIHTFMTDTDIFRNSLEHKLSRSRVHEISYRLVGVSLNRGLLRNCNHIIQMGPVFVSDHNELLETFPESRYLEAREGLLLKGDSAALFKAPPLTGKTH